MWYGFVWRQCISGSAGYTDLIKAVVVHFADGDDPSHKVRMYLYPNDAGHVGGIGIPPHSHILDICASRGYSNLRCDDQEKSTLLI